MVEGQTGHWNSLHLAEVNIFFIRHFLIIGGGQQFFISQFLIIIFRSTWHQYIVNMALVCQHCASIFYHHHYHQHHVGSSVSGEQS